MPKHFVLLVVVALTLLSSCSSSPSHQQSLGITAEDAQISEDLERLKEAHTTLAARLANAKQEDFPADFTLLDRIGERIVMLQTKRLEKSLDESRVQAQGDYQNKVPLPELERLKKQLETDKNLNANLLPPILHPVIREQTSTRGLIGRLETEAGRDDLSAERRATVYHELYVLSGTGQWLEARDKQMDVIIEAIRTAAAQNNYSTSLENKIDFVRSIYVDKPTKTIDEMHGIYADLLVARYTRARASGDRDASYKVLQNLAQKQDFPAIKAKLGPRAQSIADDYAAVVSESISRRWNPADTLRDYQRETEVRALLGLQPKSNPETPLLAQQLADKFQTLKSKNPSAALGFLFAQQSIAPQSPGVGAALEQQLLQIRNATISSLSVEKFRSRYDNLNYGEAVTPLVSQYLHQLLGGRIKVIEGDSKDVDALVTGNILEVKVESSQTSNKKQMLVNVGEVQSTNPAYLAWLELPSKERRNIPKPDETVSEQKQKNIFITTTIHRKVGIFAVTYRLVDNKTNGVIFPDSITLQTEYEDESNEGLEVGELVVPYKLAKLPSDTEILQKLSKDVAEAIAGNLVGVLENQEIEYIKAADRSAAQNNCQEEVQNLAKSVALLASKNQKTAASDTARQRLIQRSLTCF